LLFLAAGAVIESLHHEHNIFRMGGLKNKMPLVFYTFLAGAASLAALPLVTAGFYSKEPILLYAANAENGNYTFWVLALAGAFLTALYTTRLMLIVFWGDAKTAVTHLPGKLIAIPLIVLAILSVFVGFIEWPHNIFHLRIFSDFVE